jgi:signal transduction histidine kinase
MRCNTAPVPCGSLSTAPNKPLRVRVTNKGCIAPEILPRLFEPLRRSDGHSEGLGLGLYIVREIARGHNGRVDVGIDASFGETTFTLELPRGSVRPAA